MKSSIRSLGFAIAAFGLFACNQDDKIAAPGKGAEGTGTARFALPSLPADYLAKSAAGAHARFLLTVSGEGMAPIEQSWTLSAGQPESVYVTGIPAGYVRSFHGRLMKIDSARYDSAVTHEGWDSVYIDRDSVAEVRLLLRKKGGGSAHVCVEVEGWPSDTTCIKPPIPIPAKFAGCWNVSITKPGTKPAIDTVFKAKLRIVQWDTTLLAYITWNSGARDSSFGYVRFDGTAIIGNPGGGFTLKGGLDSAMGNLNGYFISDLRHISGSLLGTRAACDTIVVPPIDTPLTACFNVSQSITNGKIASGRLILAQRGLKVWGSFRWQGFPAMYVYNDTTGRGSITDLSYLSLFGVAPKGLIGSGSPDTVSYRATLTAAKDFSGSLYQLFQPGWKQVGGWKGARNACTVKDSIP
ncbi:MAG: hypothetical protein JWP91_4293 [Fibrobacteres bacterium]|nr:hypothetical protein [Fibrobacterota bacterium]